MYDEPTAGLDPVASTVIEDLIRNMHNGVRGPGGISSYIVRGWAGGLLSRGVAWGMIMMMEGRGLLL